MIRLVIDLDACGTTQGTKEAVAMALEHLGDVRVVSVQAVQEQMTIKEARK